MDTLVDKIKKEKAVIGVIGLGYVGLPLALLIARSGYKVIGIDKDKEKIKKLNDKKSYISDVSNKEIDLGFRSLNLSIYNHISTLQETDIIVICVPTPITKDYLPDTSYISSCVQSLMQIDISDKLIVLESTTYPGSTQNLIANEFEKLGYVVGQDYYLGYSPERVNPGVSQEYKEIVKVTAGITSKCSALTKLFYSTLFSEVYSTSTVEIAESTKLLELNILM